MKTELGALAKNLMDENAKLRDALKRLWDVASGFDEYDSLAAALDQAAEALGDDDG